MLLLLLACVTRPELQALEGRVSALETELAAANARIVELESSQSATTLAELPSGEPAPVDCSAPTPLDETQYRITPHRGPDGNVDGYRISALRRDGWLACGGLRNGDILQRLNGAAVTDPQLLMTALAADPKTWRVDGLRRGAPLSLGTPDTQ